MVQNALALLLAAFSAGTISAQTGSDTNLPPITGQWDFDNGDLSASIGRPLLFRGDTELDATFTTMTIGGETANVMGFPAVAPTQGLIMEHGAQPNGGGTNVNQYTLIMDIFYSADAFPEYRALLQTSTNNADDADIFLNPLNGIGISGQYHGDVTSGEWHRIALGFDLTNNVVHKYVDGVLVNSQLLGQDLVDGRWSLGPSALLFTDDDFETQAGFVNSIQFRAGLLTEEQVRGLGTTPTASGIPGGPVVEQVRVTIRKGTGNNVEITASPAGTYQLVRKTTLSDTSWTPVAGTTPGSQFTVAATGPTAFFRVLRQ